ncbi:hypothetical protein [Haloarchaeobius sp. DYHT-AS-18]|uniref:hypothetical protein n=1 Tax=Haloarchaeobius sp. DYHT-AS-18 TaxID=3446117 RepID=UPI003EB9C94B
MDTSNPEYEFLLTLAWRTFLLAVAGFGVSSVVLGNLPIVPIVSPDLPGALANAGRLATLVVVLAYLSLRLEEYGQLTETTESATTEPDDAT